MKCNVGKKDKALRLLAATGIAILGFYFQSWWGLLAIVPFFTGLISFCPLYSLLGITTCKTDTV